MEYIVLGVFGFYILYHVIHKAIVKALKDSEDLIANAVLKALNDTKNPENNSAGAVQEPTV